MLVYFLCQRSLIGVFVKRVLSAQIRETELCNFCRSLNCWVTDGCFFICGEYYLNWSERKAAESRAVVVKYLVC